MHSMHAFVRLLLLAIVLFVARPAGAAPLLFVDPPLEDAVHADVVPALKQLLGQDYPRFRQNFDASATPVPLQHGGLMLAGWRLGFPDHHAAVVVLHTDGALDAAYYNADGRPVRYFSNADQPQHLALWAWARQFDIHHRGGGPLAGAWQGAHPATGEGLPSAEDQAAMRTVAAVIWSPALAERWNMNADVGHVLGDTTQQIMECSKAFSLVPRPVGWVPGWSYVARTAVQIVTYVSGVSGSRVYRSCVIAAANRQRSLIEAASVGVLLGAEN